MRRAAPRRRGGCARGSAGAASRARRGGRPGGGLAASWRAPRPTYGAARLPLLGIAGLLGAAVPAGGDGADAAPREAYRVERRGQDTYVLRDADGAVVYTTGVAETSEGSDTDEDLHGDEEFFHGCLWTFRQQLGMCEGGACADAEILAHDLQRRLWAFYSDRQATAAPPLEEAAWMTLGTTREQRQELAESCPGLVVAALLFMAEALDFSGSGDAFAREAELYAAALEQRDARSFGTMLEMFPVREAYEGHRQAAERRQRRAAPPGPSVDVVVARCTSSLQWLWELDFPARTRVFVYDKCRHDVAEFRAETRGLQGAVAAVEHRPMDESGPAGLMTGECTAYLTHIVDALQHNQLADYTVFVHDDAPRHIRLSLLSLALGGLRSGAYDVPFLHLVHERYPAFRTPCLKDVYRRAMGTELVGRLSTYCCAHFIVSRPRIEAHPVEFYANLMRLVSGGEYSRQRGGECNVGSKPCYVMEFLWHRIFGEAEELPPRAEQATLPLALRYEGGRESQLPSPLKVAPYMAAHQPGRYSRLLAQSR